MFIYLFFGWQGPPRSPHGCVWPFLVNWRIATALTAAQSLPHTGYPMGVPPSVCVWGGAIQRHPEFQWGTPGRGLRLFVSLCWWPCSCGGGRPHRPPSPVASGPGVVTAPWSLAHVVPQGIFSGKLFIKPSATYPSGTPPIFLLGLAHIPLQ